MIETSLDLLRSSSAIFCNLQLSSETARNLREMLGNVFLVFGTIFENLRKSSENPQKMKTTASKYDQKRPKNSQGCAKMF